MSEHDEHGEHSDWIYVKIFLVLGALTGVEVFMYFESVHNLSDVAIRLILITLMVVKFFLVGAYFMHLKGDNSVFTQVFVAGMIIAYPVYFAMAYAFGFLGGWEPVWKVVLMVVPPLIAAIGLKSWRSGENTVADAGPVSPLAH